jgi:hypothetical protein
MINIYSALENFDILLTPLLYDSRLRSIVTILFKRTSFDDTALRD